MVKTIPQGQTRSSIQTSGQDNLSRPTSRQIGQGGRTPPRSGLSLLAAVKKHPVIAVLALILSVLAVLTLFPSEEKKVRKQFEVLSKWCPRNQEKVSSPRLARLRRSFLCLMRIVS